MEPHELNNHRANGQQSLDALLAQASAEEHTDFQMLWALTGDAGDPRQTDQAEEARVWHNLDALINMPEPEVPEQPRLRRLIGYRGWMAVAASLLIGAVGLALWMQPVIHTAPPGERLMVQLPDGSEAEINGGATLRYARRFGAERAVQLEGEAFFAVVKDSRPFRVETFNAQVEVLGTRFNVKAWPDGQAPTTTVTLESGRVALAARAQPSHAVEMTPGETRTVGPDAVPSPPDTTTLHRALAWRTGALIYHNEPLGVVLEDLERRFGVALLLRASALRHRRISFSEHNPTDAETVIRTLCAGYRLNYRATTTGYELYDPGMN